MKKKTIIISIVTVILAIAGMIFGITYTNEDIEKISEGIETVVEIVSKNADNQSTIEIPEAYLEDEEALEEQEVESEAFELQGEIAYNGSSELPTIPVGEYAGLTYYSQIDSRWKNLPYTSTGDSTQTIGSSACGPTCAAMIVSSIRGNIDVPTMCNYFVDYGFRSANNGTYWSAFRWTADVFDIEYTETIYLDKACELLQNGYYLVTACGNGLFTTGGHFIMLYGYDGNYIKVYDPYLYSGKFNTSTRRGKAIVDGNTVLVTKDNFRNYANYGTFFCFKNDRKDEPIPTPTPTTATYNRYVKVNSSLNVRSGPGTEYDYLRSLYNGNEVTVYEDFNNWSKIGENEWVCADYLTDSNIAINNTVGEYKKLKETVNLYSNADLSGTVYTYLKNTKVLIKKNINANIDYIYVPATGRYAYINNSAYTEKNSSLTSKNTIGNYYILKSNCYLWSNSNLTGTKYSYLAKTKIKVIKNINNNVDYIYVPATGRYAYISNNLYK